MFHCNACGQLTSKNKKCDYCDSKSYEDGTFGVNPGAELTVSNTCFYINEKPFVVEYPSTEFVRAIEDIEGIKMLKYVDDKTGVISMPLTDVRGYWA